MSMVGFRVDRVIVVVAMMTAAAMTEGDEVQVEVVRVGHRDRRAGCRGAWIDGCQ